MNNKTRLLFVAFARYVYAISLIAFAMQQFYYGDFRPFILPHWPAWLPGMKIAAYVCSVLMVAIAIGLLATKDMRRFGSYLGIIILVIVLVGHLPYEFKYNLDSLGPWTGTFKLLASAGFAFILASAYHGDGKAGRLAEALIPWGPAMVGAFFIVCGIEHFLYASFVADLIPAFIPWHTFWTYFAGVALIGAGISFIFRIQLRLVAALTAIMVFLWVFLLHVPRAIQLPTALEGNEWTSVFQALTVSAVSAALSAIQKDKGHK